MIVSCPFLYHNYFFLFDFFCWIKSIQRWRSWAMCALEREPVAAGRPCLQHLLHDLLLHPVHRCQRQVLVHAWALLLRRLLHHSALFCINILGQDMDRWEHVDFATNGIHPSILIKWTIWNFTLESKVFSQDSGSCELCGWWQFRTSCSTSTSSRPPPPSGNLPSTCSWRTLPPPCLGPTARLWPWPSQLSPQIFWYNCDQKDILAQLKSTVVTLATHILNVTYLWQWHR